MRWLPLYLLLVAGLSPGIPRCNPRALVIAALPLLRPTSPGGGAIRPGRR